MKIPSQLKIIYYSLKPFTNRKITLPLSAFSLFLGYQSGDPETFSRCTTIVTTLGLILTIKHNFLSSLTSEGDLVKFNCQEEAQCGPPLEEIEVNEEMIEKAKDQGYGLILIILSAAASIVA